MYEMVLNRDMTRNSTRHLLWTNTETGETRSQTCRNSLGGWARMMERLAAELGSTLRATDDTATTWATADGQTWRWEEWMKL